MVKIIYNNLIIDLCREERYLKYLPQQNHYIEVKKYLANAILGSDNNTVYHLSGTPYNFPNEIKSVKVKEIEETEYKTLAAQRILQDSQTEGLREEVDSLKQAVIKQNELIQQLLNKLM